jgi:catechol 2,3-dioxygenase-like lactoylglutathione lyase family enzyme
MNRGIDHLVLCVDDLDAARRIYERLGFTTTPRAVHPFGTGNSLVQLQGNFIELLAVVEPEKIRTAEPGHLSFGAHNAAFLETGPGISMLAFASDDAHRDQAEFCEKGLRTYPTFDFSRQATLPGGEQVTVAFSLAYVTDERMPDIAFFVCQQHAPEYFWKPEFQVHANGAVAVTEVVMVAEEPASLGDLFAKLQGRENVEAYDERLAVETARGRISVLSPGRVAERFPAVSVVDSSGAPRFAGYRVSVADIGHAEALLGESGAPFCKNGDRLQIDPADAFGVIVEFAPEGAR